MLENQEGNWEVHTLKKGRKEIEVERQIQGAAWEIHIFPFILFSDLHINQ